MKTKTIVNQTQNPPVARQPSEDEIRSYAYYLYDQAGHCDGHDVEHWLEAEAWLRDTSQKEGVVLTNLRTQSGMRQNLALMNHGLPAAAQTRSHERPTRAATGTDVGRRSIRPWGSNKIKTGLSLSAAPTAEAVKANQGPQSRNPVPTAIPKTEPKSPLVSSRAMAEREIAGLRRGQAERDATRTPADYDIQATLI
ncbi:MAG: DUF2934 domain-containing protein [Opitutaceae bacterium]